MIRYLEYTAEIDKIDVIFMDPDVIKEHNLSRQGVHDAIGKNKAIALVERIKAAIPLSRVNLFASTDAFSPKTVKTLRKWFLKDGVFLFGCVDHHPTRVLIQEEAAKLRNVLYLAGGNEEIDGQVQIYLKRNGREILPRIDAVHPEMALATGGFPDAPDCSVEAVSKPQLLWANMAAAYAMGAVFHRYLSGELLKENEVHFKVMGPTMDPVFNPAVVKEEICPKSTMST